jgi:transcription factor IIIB subunit 2
LEEFKQTPSSDLTVGDFQNVWLEQEADPPAFANPKKRKQPEDDEDANFLEASMVQAIASRKKTDGGTEYQEDIDEVENDFSNIISSKEMQGLVDDTDKGDKPNYYTLFSNDEVLEKELELLDDDHEIANALLDDQEVEFKTMIWTNENKDWLEAQAEKKRKELELRERGLEPKPPRVRRRKKGSEAPEPEKPKASSAAEAARNMLNATSKRISKKLNYAAIDNLFHVDDSMREKIRLKREASFATSRAQTMEPQTPFDN